MFKYLFLLLASCGLLSCQKNNFFEDLDDPGISRFTNYGYNVSSAYINGEPWVRPFNRTFFNYGRVGGVRVFLQEGPGPVDSLHINFPGEFATGALFAHGAWREFPYLTFTIAVKKNFTSADFLAMAGKTFPENGSSIRMSMGLGLPNVPDMPTVYGTGKIYLVRLGKGDPSNAQSEFLFSGLYEGNIRDSILVTKGRFDYSVADDQNNIPD